MLVRQCFSRVYCIKKKQISKEKFMATVGLIYVHHAFCFVFGTNLRTAQELR